jgi:hypothetical protein
MCVCVCNRKPKLIWEMIYEMYKINTTHFDRRYILYIMYKIEINICVSKVVYENEQRTSCWWFEE